jgi:hypothetical protein
MGSMTAESRTPICSICMKPVDRFVTGKHFRRGGQLFYESSCHGEVDRVEYWPVIPRQDIFVPEHAFPSERPPPETVKQEPPRSERNVLDIQDELFELPSWKRLTRIEHFQITVRMLEQNARDLTTLLEYLTTDERSFSMSDVKHRAALDQVFEEVLRRLHNFVSSALTLVDHTRVLYQELYSDTDSFQDYQVEVDRRFVTDPLIQFVQKLRHLAQHVRLPDISLQLKAGRDVPLTRSLLLRKGDLLLFSGWNAPAKKYLEAAADTIDLKTLVESYTAAIRAFYRWMEERQLTIHAADIAEVAAKKAEARLVLSGEVPGLLDSGLSIWAQGIGSAQDIFAAVLSPADWVLLSKHEGDLGVWTAEAIKMTEAKFGDLPRELVLRIEKAVTNRSGDISSSSVAADIGVPQSTKRRTPDQKAKPSRRKPLTQGKERAKRKKTGKRRRP